MPRIRAASIDEHKVLVRGNLMDSAKKLIAEAGTAEISLGEVALAAGVGRTTLYDYFTDRDDLIASIVAEELPGVLKSIIESVPSDGSPSDRLADLAARTVEFVASDPVLGLILHREVGRLGSDAQNRIREAHSTLADEMVGLYFLGVDSGEFLRMPPDLAGRLIQDVIMSSAKTVMTAAEPEDRIEEVTAHLRIFLIGGLRASG
ncbi:MAG: TetR/AcrR family transcriptional regulator [Acidobacteria bacterium]|nr:TetR/AcrR family transcriptional regulator [Acidobacteriota bacterium]